jgi:asparagine synthase (glutamine-hydrolysing)
MGSLTVASVPMIEGILAGSGSTVHLNGHAGDALFGPVSTMLWSLLHSREKHRFRQSWRFRVVNKLPLGPTLRMVARRGTYLDDLRRIAADDFGRRDDAVASQSRWTPLPKVHPALTDAARGHLRDLATAAVQTDQRQLAADRTSHQILQYLVVHGNDVRRMNQAASPAAGIHFDSPYLDRRVVETSLSLRIGDRTRQYPAKPLLAAARPAEMSLEYFTRRDKGDYSREVFEQHQALKPLLKDLFSDGSALADAGLVSQDRVLRAINEFSIDGSAYTELEYFAFAERWLRSATAGPTRRNRRW